MGYFQIIIQIIFFIFHFIIFILATYLILKIYYDDKSLKLISSLLLAGAIGNSFDRFFLNGVVDFIDIYYKDFHWPALILPIYYLFPWYNIIFIRIFKET